MKGNVFRAHFQKSKTMLAGLARILSVRFDFRLAQRFERFLIGTGGRNRQGLNVRHFPENGIDHFQELSDLGQ